MLLGTLLFSSCSLVPRDLVLSDKPELHIMQLPLQLVVCVISTSVLRRSKAASKSLHVASLLISTLTFGNVGRKYHASLFIRNFSFSYL